MFGFHEQLYDDELFMFLSGLERFRYIGVCKMVLIPLDFII